MHHCSVFATIKDDGGGTVAEKHPCDRVCVAGAAPMECSYTFNVELYNTLSKACYDCPLNITDCHREHCISADGMERGLITVNRWEESILNQEIMYRNPPPTPQKTRIITY